MNNRFAFIGRAGSGKDYVARKIRKVHGEGISARFAFADKVKEDIVKILGIPSEEWELFLHSEDYKNNMRVDLGKLKVTHKDSLVDKKLVNASEVTEDIVGDINNYYMSLREFMVYYGTYIMRKSLGENIWVNQLFNSESFKKKIANPDILVTITDVRFPNEYKACKEAGFKIIKVVNPESSLGIDNVAESYIDEFEPDYTFYNYQGYPDKFKESLVDFINKFKISISK